MLEEVMILSRKEFLECFRELRSFVFFLAFCSFFFPQFVMFGNPQISSAMLEDAIKKDKIKLGIHGAGDIVRDALRNHEDIIVSDCDDPDPGKAVKDEKFDIVISIPPALKTEPLAKSHDIRRATAGDGSSETDAEREDAPGVKARSTIPELTVMYNAQKDAPGVKASNKIPELTVMYNAQKETSLTWVITIASDLIDYNKPLLRKRLKEIGITEEQPGVTFKSITTMTKEDHLAPLSQTVPYVILFFIATVAISGAIGGITIERENKRLLYLLLMPVRRTSIIYALLLVLSVLSLIPIIFGLLALSGMFQLPAVAARLAKHGLALSITPATFAATVLLSAVLSAVVTSSAVFFSTLYRNAQQARGYSLLYMVIVNALVGWLLSVGLSHPILCLIPVANLTECLKQVLIGANDWFFLIASVLTSAAFTYLFAKWSAPLLGREDLLMGLDKPPRLRRRLFPGFPVGNRS
ncbi:MAG TPA: ABC transporter permease [Candidatus Obscuribacterales bacterium]